MHADSQAAGDGWRFRAGGGRRDVDITGVRAVGMKAGGSRASWDGGLSLRTSTFLRHFAVSGRHHVLPSTLWSDVAGCDVSAMTS